MIMRISRQQVTEMESQDVACQLSETENDSLLITNIILCGVL